MKPFDAMVKALDDAPVGATFTASGLHPAVYTKRKVGGGRPMWWLTVPNPDRFESLHAGEVVFAYLGQPWSLS